MACIEYLAEVLTSFERDGDRTLLTPLFQTGYQSVQEPVVVMQDHLMNVQGLPNSHSNSQ